MSHLQEYITNSKTVPALNSKVYFLLQCCWKTIVDNGAPLSLFPGFPGSAIHSKQWHPLISFYLQRHFYPFLKHMKRHLVFFFLKRDTCFLAKTMQLHSLLKTKKGKEEIGAGEKNGRHWPQLQAHKSVHVREEVCGLVLPT